MNETHFERRRGIRVSAAYAVTVVCAAAALFGVSCTTEGKPVVIGDYLPDPPAFTSLPEAGADAEAGLISYCPSNKCPPGWTTCPDSRFPCDTNILADSRNCGGCGVACPPGTWKGEQFTCNEGACKMECADEVRWKDCDGLVDNGCESPLRDSNNCGACGVVCAGECIYQDAMLTQVACECPPGTIACGGGDCIESETNDGNCGACDNACDKTGGPGAPQYPNVYYGCLAGECGKLKCHPRFADCDNKLENGCETSTFTDDNCGGCGIKCSAGERCVLQHDGRRLCLCAEGLTFCQTGEEDGLPRGYCADLSSDESNCGGCGTSCEYFGAGLRERRMCDFGKCGLRCVDGWVNCNGALSDGCEIDTKSDPRNCGGCGITCDLTLGQACVAGKCVVEPCDQADAGEVTR